MGEKYGTLTSSQLAKAIEAVQQNRSVQHSSLPEYQFLKSIRASCSHLPHTNEAALEARRIFFSYLVAFGLPAIFLTVTPEDSRNHRIVVYALTKEEYDYENIKVDELDDSTILADFKVHEQTRVDYPGLCAEEYRRIIDLVISHVLNWSEEEKKAKGIGLFGEIIAYCLATEQQGRHTLHGHFLCWVKDWNKMLQILTLRSHNKVTESFSGVVRNAKQFYGNACSAQLFSDFDIPNGLLSEQAIFYHDNCRSARLRKEMRFTPKEVEDQQLREMRHCQHWRKYNGHIATCEKCGKEFTVQEIIQNALNYHLGAQENVYAFPDRIRRLDRFVYEEQKNFSSVFDNTKENAIRYFANNAVSNVHNFWHAPRCFKKGRECYTNLPEVVFEKIEMLFCEEPDIWSDWCGMKEPRYMFRFYPRRNIEDSFMNTHNVYLTKLLGCNTNVMAGMTGAAAFYTTNYCPKDTQEDERFAFEKVSDTLIKALEKRENTETEDIIPEYQQGFRNLLAAIYIHTNAHITAAPMSHYLAIHKSRFRYSHNDSWHPFNGIEKLFDKEPMIMRFRKTGERQVAFHRAMHYLHRPVEFEHMCSYAFEQELQVVSLTEAKKLHTEWYEFTHDHPLRESLVVVYRKSLAVPIVELAEINKGI